MTKTPSPWDDDKSQGPWETETKIKPSPKVVNIDNFKPRDSMKWYWIVIAFVGLWLASGFYQVQPAEQGIVLRFGAYQDTTFSGLHYHLPYPIETVKKVNVTQERSITVGVSEMNNSSFTESHMLTGDENIVDINLTIVWTVKNAKDYLFNMRSPDETVRVAAQSVLREIVGQSNMQDIITSDRGKIEDDTKLELQKVLNEFQSGIEIIRAKLQKADPPKQVVDAFNEVQRAKADMEKYKNEAEAYSNEILPKARGAAEQSIQNAKAYKAGVVNNAQGDAERFISVYNGYRQGKDVTIKRLYIETMEQVLVNSKKVIIDQSKNNTPVLPYLPLSGFSSKGVN